jgi:DDE superfamily endonuclease
VGVHFTEVTPMRSAYQLAGFLNSVADFYRHAKTIHWAMDNLNTHRRKPLVDPCGEAEADGVWKGFRCTTRPQHGGWLNQAEIEIGLLARQCLGKGRLGDIDRLRTEARDLESAS